MKNRIGYMIVFQFVRRTEEKRKYDVTSLMFSVACQCQKQLNEKKKKFVRLISLMYLTLDF